MSVPPARRFSFGSRVEVSLAGRRSALARFPAIIACSLGLASVAFPASAQDAIGPADPGDAIALGDDAAKPAAFAVEVLVLHATNSGKGIDPKIGDMPELKKPPFSAYDSYELLNSARLPLDKARPQRMRLPNRRVLETRLLQVLPKDTFRISASINQPKGKEFLPLLEVKAKLGQAFIVAGQSYKKGILVLVLRVVR